MSNEIQKTLDQDVQGLIARLGQSRKNGTGLMLGAGDVGVLHEALHKLSEGWIDVNDKMPDKLSKVLIAYHPYDKKENGYCYAVCFVNKYLDFFSTEAEEYIEFATHWMPLPKEPSHE